MPGLEIPRARHGRTIEIHRSGYLEPRGPRRVHPIEARFEQSLTVSQIEEALGHVRCRVSTVCRLVRVRTMPRLGLKQLMPVGICIGVAIMSGCYSEAPVQIQKPVATLIADLDSPRPQVRHNAAYTLVS